MIDVYLIVELGIVFERNFDAVSHVRSDDIL
jgi:hypothetical protein